MSNDSAGLTDEVQVRLNGVLTGQLQSLPDRPADSAGKDAWVDYVVSLGADRTYVTTTTEHFDERENASVEEPGLTKAELVELADRLGG